MTAPTLKNGTESVIEHFIAEKLRKTGAKGYVLGVSGGIDSAVVLRLAVGAVGKEKVLGLIMPEKDSPRDDLEDAKMLCELEGVQHRIIDISDAVESFSRAVGAKIDRRGLANIKARCRMILLYHFAGKDERLVLGTSNKSEMLIGYFTKHGDGGADLEPIGDLYKTEVRQLAEVLEIPEKIIDRAPSAGLWPGQADEKEIGMSYENLDSVLLTIELALDSDAAVERTGVSKDKIDMVARMVRSSSHKRKVPAVVKIGLRTPGLDWREGDEDL
ncbi:MAG: NAD+ synthase [Candidatus Thermoplasmatota archaeon]|nr:NAD+ synthase [Candidatus Thermoplasmatota archaeon]